jgi:Flp pilus assembly protein TadG
MIRGRRDQRGSAAIFLVMFSVVMFAAAGLVVDGGIAINARMRIADDAEQASRAGAGAIDIDHLRDTGELRLRQAEAADAAGRFLQRQGYAPGQYAVVVTGFDRVEVRVRDTVQAGMLALIGVSEFEVKAEAAASPETGE